MPLWLDKITTQMNNNKGVHATDKDEGQATLTRFMQKHLWVYLLLANDGYG
jgi:hypothetical protein